ncbi:MAG: hypothetical protein WA172_11395 [Terriglobales bacterium]
MIHSQTITGLGLVAVLGVLLIFLLPGSTGPYSVVNGPATALMAAHQAHQLLLGIAKVAQSPLQFYPIPSVFVFSWVTLPLAGLRQASPVGCDTTLRC